MAAVGTLQEGPVVDPWGSTDPTGRDCWPERVGQTLWNISWIDARLIINDDAGGVDFIAAQLP